MVGLNSGPFSHEASPAEVERIWPAVRAARVFDSLDSLAAFSEAAPWRVRIDRHGGAAVFDRWRAHLDVLAVRGLWAPDRRVASWIAEARTAAAERGYTAVLSPLLPAILLGPWLAAGMRVAQPVVALQGTPTTIARVAVPEGVTIRPASPSDLPAVARVDATGFDAFWRFEIEDLVRVSAEERLVVAVRNGQVVGYTLGTVTRGAAVLSRLTVLPEHRRCGIGSALVSDAAEHAERVGGVTFTLCTQESNQASRALYRSMGLYEVDERYGLAILDGIEDR